MGSMRRTVASPIAWLCPTRSQAEGRQRQNLHALIERLICERCMLLSITDLVLRCLLLVPSARPLLEDMPGCEEGGIRQHHQLDGEEGAHVESGLHRACWAGRQGWALARLRRPLGAEEALRQVIKDKHKIPLGVTTHRPTYSVCWLLQAN